MRSFNGRDILSLKEFERQEFFHVFEIAQQMEPIVRARQNTDLCADKTLVTAFLPTQHHAPVSLMNQPCTDWVVMSPDSPMPK